MKTKLLILFSLFIYSQASIAQPLNGKLKVIVGNIGQGDAILLRCPHDTHEMLIDAGANNQEYKGGVAMFQNFISSFQTVDNPLEVVVASHPHADHIGNMSYVLQTYKVEKYIDNGFPFGSTVYNESKKLLKEKRIKYFPVNIKGGPVEFCDQVKVQVLHPSQFEIPRPDSDINNRSVILRVDHGENSFLFVGDCEKSEEKLLLNDTLTATLLDVDFLKVGHHGSETSTNPEFLTKVSPDIAVISCGQKDIWKNSRHKHPRYEVVEALNASTAAREGEPRTEEAYHATHQQWETIKLNKAVYLTKTEGTMVFESDGKKIKRVIN